MTQESSVKDGSFQVTLEAPAKLPWPHLILRVYAANEREEGMAVRILDVKKPSTRRTQIPSGGR
jgi:hypothetical protein